MDFQELKRQSNRKILFRAKSGRGKTRNCSLMALDVMEEGGTVKYVDTESEGSTTMVKMVESGEYDESVVENLDYVQVDDYDSLMDAIKDGWNYDLLVVDTLDHKHSMVLKSVTDARTKAGADWNQYPKIYSEEKQVMEELGKPQSNVIATIDPESGSVDKPKGAQTNIHGYFNTVADLKKGNDEWVAEIRNWVNEGDKIGASVEVDDLVNRLTNEILESANV